MKSKLHSACTRRLFLWLAWAAMPGVAAEDLSIDWYTVDGGGGSTSAGEFTLSGTVGQTDAGMLVPFCCGNMSVLGGYWSQFIDVDQPDGPLLCISLTRTNTVLLSWRNYHAGYALQEKPAAAPSWNEVPATPLLVLADKHVPLDEFAGWVTLVHTNQGGGPVTNSDLHLTGFGWYLYTNSLGGIPPPGCLPPVFCVTNAPTFFRLRKN
jgi:hypothetical protein